MIKTLEFSKVLARYYHGWLRGCCDSILHCEKIGDETRAEYYRNKARSYSMLIGDNWKAIEFFSIEHNAFKIDSTLPEEFRGYP